MIRGVLFDMDGTLVDSESLWHIADKAWLDGYGITLSDEEWVHIVGKGGAAFVRELMEHKGLSGKFEDLLHEKNQVFIKIAREQSVAFDEMIRFAKMMRQRGIPTSIASASSPEIIEATIGCIKAEHLFDHFCSGDSVPRSKPDPMLFLHAADLMNVDPADCLVIEDSQYGVEAGHRAGMTVVGVPHAIPEEKRGTFEKADLLFEEGMREFTADALLDWLENRGLLSS